MPTTGIQDGQHHRRPPRRVASRGALASLGDTRQLLLLGVKRRGCATVEELAADAYMSIGATRRHLHELREEGFLHRSSQSAGPGRPRFLYSLTEQGDQLFPQNYRWLAEALLRAIDAEGPELAERIRSRFLTMNVTEGMERLGDHTGRRRLGEFVELLDEQGYLPRATDLADGTTRLEMVHCPLLGLAMARPGICALEEAWMTHLLGEGTLTREKHRLAGDPLCSYVVRMPDDRPIAK